MHKMTFQRHLQGDFFALGDMDVAVEIYDGVFCIEKTPRYRNGMDDISEPGERASLIFAIIFK